MSLKPWLSCAGTSPLWPRRRVVVAGGSLAALFMRPAIAQVEPAGQVEEVKGQVTAELETQRRVLVPRADVFNGDDVATAENSRAALRLGTDTSLRLGANARVRIDRFVINAGGVLTLETGPLLLDKGHGDPGRPVQVRGSFGLITVRGTKIFVGPGQGKIGIFVIDGVIDVAAGGQEFVLQRGEGVEIARPGARATAPVVWSEAKVRAALASVD